MSTEEKRHEPRFVCRKTLDVLALADGVEGRFRRVKLIDCSCSGIGFATREPALSGEQLLVKMPVRKRGVALMYTVRRCDPSRSNPGEYVIGAKFSGYAAIESGENMQRILETLLGHAEPPQAE
jgi:hypothetical protein